MTRLEPGAPGDSWSDASVQVGAEELEAIARRRIDQARVDILLEHPYFAAALLVMPMRGTSEPAIRNAVATDGHRIVYRYDLVAELERPTVRHLILHALAHALLRHPERGADRDWRTWTAACDVAVEGLFETLGLKVPGVPADPSRSFEWSQGLSAEAIFAKLESLGIPSASSAWEGASSSASRGGGHADDADRMRDGLIAPPPSSHASAGDGSDHHAARTAMQRALLGVPPPPTNALDSLRRQFEQSVQSIEREKRCGHAAGSGNSEIDAAGSGSVPWQTHLARFMRERMSRDWSFAHPNRKHLWRGLYLPGPANIEGGHFVVAIDTSGSMSDRELSHIVAEVDAIRRSCDCELTVLQFDAAIQATARFSSFQSDDELVGSTRIMRCFGRGGTDLRLPFAWAEEARRNGDRISALIVATDGYGPLPECAPDGLPVLFLLTPQHAPPRFGVHVTIDRG